MKRQLVKGDRVAFKGNGEMQIGTHNGQTPGGLIDVIADKERHDGGFHYYFNEESLSLAPYPYGEYIPTEGFDVARMPTDTSPLAVCYDSPSLHVPQWGMFWGDKFTRLMLPITVEQIQAEFTDLYIVPPKTTK